MKKIVLGVCFLAILAGGIAAFAASRDGPAVPAGRGRAGASAPGKVASSLVPEIPLPSNSKDAQALMEVNKMIAGIMQEAARRPPDQQLTQEQIKQMVISKVEDIRAQR